MSLLDLQRAFYAEISADDEAAPPSCAGMAIYRNAWRGRLIEALEVSFERTRRWTGEDAFTAAACHYVLANPPRGWTLDLYGEQFPALLEELFAQDREVTELAWLEWQMQRAFAALDAPQLDPAALATAGLEGAQWDALGFVMAAGFASREVATDCTALWHALDRAEADFTPRQTGGEWLLVWRAGLVPHFRAADPAEGRALAALAGGASLGDLAAAHPPELLGAWLAGWLGEGLFSDLRLPAG